MARRTRGRTLLTLAAAGTAAATGAYGALAAVGWFRYGHPAPPTVEERDTILERFMPRHEIVERHQIAINAPATLTFAAAREMDVMQSPIARAIFKTREVVLGANADAARHPAGLIDMTRAMGWGVLAEVRDREIVMGAVTRPWEANVVFRALPPEEFAAFAEPDYVKIVWTLRVDATSANSCVFRTETRAVATDAQARSRFRRYWAFVSPGIFLIRWLSLEPLKTEAEARWLEARGLGLEAWGSRPSAARSSEL